MTVWVFALLGAAAGAGQAAWLAHEARRGPRLWSWPLRLLIVAVVLFVGARAGQLVPTLAGWAAAFLVQGVVAWRRLP